MRRWSAGIHPRAGAGALAPVVLVALLAAAGLSGCGSGSGAGTTTVVMHGSGAEAATSPRASAGSATAGAHGKGASAAGGGTQTGAGAANAAGTGGGGTSTGSHSQGSHGGGARSGGAHAGGSAHPSQSAGAASSGGAYEPGEVYTPSGAFTLSSPAFALNGSIPSQYTCDGAGTSPPLQWRNLPAHTAELVLFVIDDTTVGRAGGIRWIVAGLEPSLGGIAAGSLPSGAVVGLNGENRAAYGGICPAKGHTARVELVLWALSQKIPLSSGFVPALAEHEYSTHELASAVTYAEYTRP